MRLFPVRSRFRGTLDLVSLATRNVKQSKTMHIRPAYRQPGCKAVIPLASAIEAIELTDVLNLVVDMQVEYG